MDGPCYLCKFSGILNKIYPFLDDGLFLFSYCLNPWNLLQINEDIWIELFQDFFWFHCWAMIYDYLIWLTHSTNIEWARKKKIKRVLWSATRQRTAKDVHIQFIFNKIYWTHWCRNKGIINLAVHIFIWIEYRLIKKYSIEEHVKIKGNVNKQGWQHP